MQDLSYHNIYEKDSRIEIGHVQRNFPPSLSSSRVVCFSTFDSLISVFRKSHKSKRTTTLRTPSTRPIGKCWVLQSYFTRRTFYPRVTPHAVCVIVAVDRR